MPERTTLTGSPSAKARALRLPAALLVLAWSALTYRQVLATPGDHLSRWALAASALVLVVGAFLPGTVQAVSRALSAVPTRRFVLGCAAAAFAISLWMVLGPMHDRPISIDGSVYLFEARALSHLHFGMPIPAPRLPFGGRFLFEGPDGRLYGVFPPGFPLFVAIFVRLGMPLLVGPVVSALLVAAQWALGRSVASDEGPTRLALVLSIVPFARAVETGDLLSHAFVAVLATAAAALALRAIDRRSAWSAAAAAACAGWAFSARLLDGAMVGALVAAILLFGAVRRRLGPRALVVATLAALPFVALLATQQHAATGSASTPTQTEYFVRSDWPPTCHRLGFGPDVGCAVEHPDMRDEFGPGGYAPRHAWAVTRSRATELGSDLFGLAPLGLLALLAAVLRGGRRDLLCAAFVVLFTFGYGLFYYGNAPLFGARHLFPVAPFFWLLLGRSIVTLPHRPTGRFGAGHVRALAGAAVVAAMAATQVPRYIVGAKLVRYGQGSRVDLRRVSDEHEIGRGVVVTGDELSWIAGFDPWADGERVLVRYDGSGLMDLRRADPTRPFHFVLAGDVYQQGRLGPPAPGLLLELEAAWPSFMRPEGLGAKIWRSAPAPASGEKALLIFEARPGATLRLPVHVSQGGHYALRVDGFVGPDHGRWEVLLDGSPLVTWDGFAETPSFRRGAPAPPRIVGEGAHQVMLRCVGRAPGSRGHVAALDAIVGVPE